MINEDILLSRGAVYKKVKKGEFIFHEGSKCSFYFQLIKGKISWQNFDEEGKVFIQSIVEPGECFGELPLFDGEPYAANAIAETDSIIIQLQKSTFHQLIQGSPEILFAFSKLLAQRVRFKFFILKEIACHNPEQRIVTLLNHIGKKDVMINNGQCKIDLTRQQIAGMTGLRVETVIRVIRKLKEKGRLTINRGKVFLVNSDSSHKRFI
ncbi:MAG TPA: Crp/Fnr family transcriptional regulator [Chitinophagales bacterium]|jgi:CRP/FNR family cyclic AMP-dependent transcriptional regulator|nr:Crp/Fnr family transcriptional regulator [Chitinophagales bacterium]HOY41101.1 Crp/Fnr family transcriptional regulator [Chitinophagales bacterium]HPH87358.1 Crp/Fnr family transcriptional regulator [Chitinophagales bacterium]HPN18466.1 Crp/Fnr family transcriptional regulator [Chitinophagales bacterium]